MNLLVLAGDGIGPEITVATLGLVDVTFPSYPASKIELLKSEYARWHLSH